MKAQKINEVVNGSMIPFKFNNWLKIELMFGKVAEENMMKNKEVWSTNNHELANHFYPS